MCATLLAKDEAFYLPFSRAPLCVSVLRVLVLCQRQKAYFGHLAIVSRPEAEPTLMCQLKLLYSIAGCAQDLFEFC